MIVLKSGHHVDAVTVIEDAGVRGYYPGYKYGDS